MESSAAQMTPQGRAIKDAAVKFGNGETLPFTPCKRGYLPISDGIRKAACPFHNEQRWKRLKLDNERFRPGEINLMKTFWSRTENDEHESQTSKEVGKSEMDPIKSTVEFTTEGTMRGPSAKKEQRSTSRKV